MSGLFTSQFPLNTRKMVTLFILQAVDARYLNLEDGRRLCLECLDSSIMDTHECQPLYLEIQEFYDGLNMKIEQQVPLLLVERQALNEAMEEEKKGHHQIAETRGLCLSEEQIISMVRMSLKIMMIHDYGVTIENLCFINNVRCREGQESGAIGS